MWLLRRDTGGAVSLGVVGGADALYAVPTGMTAAGYDVVDVSREPPDGDPAYPQNSIACGVLPS